MKKPNVIFILADDLGFGDLGSFNNEITTTPYLNQLMKEGVCLTQHYSSSPVCAPARASLLTGRYPHRTGVIDTYDILGLDRLSLEERTIGDLCQKSNIHTGLIGKWHCGNFDDKFHPNNRGFDEFIGFRGGWSNYYDWRIEYNKKYLNSDGRYLTDVFASEAVDFIKRNKDKQFYLQIAFNTPHFPLQAPEEEVVKYKDHDFTDNVKKIYAMVNQMDKGIGKVLDELKNQGIENDTVIVFTSDNGPDFGGKGDHSLERYNCNYRASKTHVFEGGIRVPGIMKWNDEIEPNGCCNELIHFTDWLPTLAEIMGIKVPDSLNLDGCNVVSQLKGGANSNNFEKRFWQWNRFVPFGNTNAAMRDGKWKLVLPGILETMPESDPQEIIDLDIDSHTNPYKYNKIMPDLIPSMKKPEGNLKLLFNIEEDPEETYNCAAKYPERVNKMLVELNSWFEEVEGERLQKLSSSE